MSILHPENVNVTIPGGQRVTPPDGIRKPDPPPAPAMLFGRPVVATEGAPTLKPGDVCFLPDRPGRYVVARFREGVVELVEATNDVGPILDLEKH